MAKKIRDNAQTWNIHHNQTLEAIRFHPNDSSKLSPYYLMHNRNTVLPLDTLIKCRKRPTHIALQEQHIAFMLVYRNMKMVETKQLAEKIIKTKIFRQEAQSTQRKTRNISLRDISFVWGKYVTRQQCGGLIDTDCLTMYDKSFMDSFVTCICYVAVVLRQSDGLKFSYFFLFFIDMHLQTCIADYDHAVNKTFCENTIIIRLSGFYVWTPRCLKGRQLYISSFLGAVARIAANSNEM